VMGGEQKNAAPSEGRHVHHAEETDEEMKGTEKTKTRALHSYKNEPSFTVLNNPA